MRAVVVYESLWGNTEKVARAVGDELGRTMTVRVFDVESAPATVDDSTWSWWGARRTGSR
jgi:flavodoxin